LTPDVCTVSQTPYVRQCILTHYSKYLFGSGIESASSFTVDKNGEIYYLGYSDTSEMSKGLNDFVIIKMEKLGDTKLWAKHYGTVGDDIPSAITVDSKDASSVYVAGLTKYPGLSKGADDGIVLKLSSATGALNWSMQLGSTGDEELFDV
jgi:hypothetical protein